MSGSSPSPLTPQQELQRQIDARRREIQTEGYPMSVGELVNLYRDNEIDIHPEFQRFFRWSPQQKSRFIESLLLGIPIPSIFVYQRRDGVWDVIDGLQRLSTILEFQGLLRDEQGALVTPNVLVGTEYLPGLSGLHWEAGGHQEGLSPDQQRLIKRAAIDIKIVRRESDESTKFDLFQRLNTGGSQLSDQEVRNCLIIMSEPLYYRWLVDLRKNEDFQSTIALSDRAAAEQYDMELILRFLLLKDLRNEELNSIGDLGDFLTKEAVLQAAEFKDDQNTDSRDFETLFGLLATVAEDSSFRRYDRSKSRFLGGFSVSAFEAVTIGTYANLDGWLKLSNEERAERLIERIRTLWSEPVFRENSGSGIRASSRIPRTIPFAKEYFRP